ncbi:phasin family protein [Ramlibacter tataouinensis]|uniref:phasin family protein n=1 Tax=Ramlibacter tataouinensis TaxID=94132 RepID=UPI0022F3FFA9|nr:phasin family protein [Ramlibacter tataouinensis]WBY00700.1 phasin family protein [Ramlibacter tataouinensis]
MVKKIQRTDTSNGSGKDKKGKGGVPLSSTVRESASQIWLAGLGAFAKAQGEGNKVFDALVKEGLSIQRKTQAVAEEKISEATNRMALMATDLSSKASGQWDKLETIFEERVARALKKLGVPSAKEVDALIARIDELNRNVAKLGGKAAAPARKSTRAAGAKTVAPATKPSRKRAAKKAA